MSEADVTTPKPMSDIDIDESQLDSGDEGDSRSSSPDPPLPPMLKRPAAQPVVTPPMLTRPPHLQMAGTETPKTAVAAPPPLKRMSTTNSNNDSAISPTPPGDSTMESDDEDSDLTDIPSSTSLFSQSQSSSVGKVSSLDSIVGKIMKTKQSDSRTNSPAPLVTPIAKPASMTNTPSNISVNDTGSQVTATESSSSEVATPPPLRKGIPSPDPSKSRRKQTAPSATSGRITESPPREAEAKPVRLPGEWIIVFYCNRLPYCNIEVAVYVA